MTPREVIAQKIIDLTSALITEARQVDCPHPWLTDERALQIAIAAVTTAENRKESECRETSA